MLYIFYIYSSINRGLTCTDTFWYYLERKEMAINVEFMLGHKKHKQ